MFSRTVSPRNERLCWKVRAIPARPPPVRAPAGHVPFVQVDGAGGRDVEAREHVDERRLAGPVRPDQADDLVPVQLERDVVQRLHAREGPRDGGGPERSSGPPARFRCDCFRQDLEDLDLRNDLGGHGADVARLVVVDLDHAVLAPEDAVELGEKLTRPESVGTFLNLSIVAARIGPLVEPRDRRIAVATPSIAAEPVTKPPVNAFSCFASARTGLIRIVPERRART